MLDGPPEAVGVNATLNEPVPMGVPFQLFGSTIGASKVAFAGTLGVVPDPSADEERGARGTCNWSLGPESAQPASSPTITTDHAIP